MSKNDLKLSKKENPIRAIPEIKPANSEVNSNPKVKTKQDIKYLIPKANDEMI